MNLTLHLKELEKGKQVKSKVDRRKSRSEQNEMKQRLQRKWKRSNKIGKLLHRLTKKKEGSKLEMRHSNETRDTMNSSYQQIGQHIRKWINSRNIQTIES